MFGLRFQYFEKILIRFLEQTSKKLEGTAKWIRRQDGRLVDVTGAIDSNSEKGEHQ